MIESAGRGKLIIGDRKADRGDAHGAKLIKRGTGSGNGKLAGSHKGSHIQYIFMQDQTGAFGSKRKLLQFLAVRVQTTDQSVDKAVFRKAVQQAGNKISGGMIGVRTTGSDQNMTKTSHQ